MFLYCSCHVDVTGLETVGSDELVHDIDEDVSGDAPPKDDVGVLEMAEEVTGRVGVNSVFAIQFQFQFR